MTESIKENLRSLEQTRNLAREELFKVIDENEHEWKHVRKLKKSYEIQFLKIWEKYRVDPKYVEQEFFESCEDLVVFILHEHRTSKEFEKICKPYYKKFEKLSKEYHLLKLQTNKKGEKNEV